VGYGNALRRQNPVAARGAWSPTPTNWRSD